MTSLSSGWLAAAGEPSASEPDNAPAAEEAVAAELAAHDLSEPTREKGGHEGARLRWRVAVVVVFVLVGMGVQTLAFWWVIPSSDSATRSYVQESISPVMAALSATQNRVDELRADLNATRVQTQPGARLPLAPSGSVIEADPPEPVAIGPTRPDGLDGGGSQTSEIPQAVAVRIEILIESGDTASAIAKRHGVGLSALAEANRTTIAGLSYLRAGDILLVPAAAERSAAGPEVGAGAR